jgi:hypothetical protein
MRKRRDLPAGATDRDNAGVAASADADGISVSRSVVLATDGPDDSMVRSCDSEFERFSIGQKAMWVERGRERRAWQ